MKKNPHPAQLFGSLLIDYFRWSQLAPMITMWFFALLMVFLLFFINHQDETLDGIWAMAEWVAKLPVIGPPFYNWIVGHETSDGVLHFGGNDFKSTAMKAWAILSLLLMVLGWLASILFGPFQPWTLKRKLGITGLACGVLMVSFLGVYLLNPEMYNGSMIRWVMTFAGIAVFLFLVSAWCLSIAHALGLLSRSLTTAHPTLN